MTQLDRRRAERIWPRPCLFALAVQLDQQLKRSAALCTWAALVCEEADESCLEAHLLCYRARILRLTALRQRPGRFRW